VKKILSIFAVLTLIFSLAACNSAKETSSAKSKEKDSKKEEVTLSYAHWNLGTEEEQNLERLMIKAFQEKYPHITVEINETVTSKDWNGTLATAASAGTMPDVFAVPNIPIALSNDWLLDVSKLTSKDKDFANVPTAIQEAATFKGKKIVVPFAQHFLGYYVNKDLFNASNLDYPEFGSSVEDFVASVKEVTNVSKGVVGLNEPNQIAEWYPAAVNPEMGWYTLKDGQYSLDSKEFITGVNLAKEFSTNGYAYSTLADEQKAILNGKDGQEVWLNGGIGIKFDGTYAASNLSEKATFDWDFIGLPGGITAIASDFLGISKSSKHAEEAYLFATWMSFSKEGFMKRMEIADTEGKVLTTLPISTDQEILDEYFAILDVPGIRTAYDNLDKAIMEPVKMVPGYVEARYQALTGVKAGGKENATTGELVTSFIKGELKVEDYAKQLDQLANQKSVEAQEVLKNK
jgi:multiple sugar transport system substrate-binding protein